MFIQNNSQRLINYNNIKNVKSNMSFGVGVTNLYSDFDGTFMPVEYNHDSICKSQPPIAKQQFESYFGKFREFIKKATGKKEDTKFKFSITTGRNLPEFNYYMRKIREQGLSMPLPNSVITCNGADEFYRRNDTDDYFKSSFNRAFLERDVNHEKRSWIKQVTGGWDGDEIRENIKKSLTNVKLDPDNVLNRNELSKIVPHLNRQDRLKLYDELIASNKNEEQLRLHLENLGKPVIDKLEGKPKDDFKWFIGEYAKKLDDVKQGKYRITVLESPTNQGMWGYGDGLSLQEKLQKMQSVPKYYASLRQDGNLNFHLAISPDLEPLSTQYINNLILSDNKNIRHVSKEHRKDIEATTVQGTQGQSRNFKPIIDGAGLDKFHDAKRKAKEIMEKGLDDLVIVAGDSTNDIEMLNLFSYVDGANRQDIPMSTLKPENLDKLHKLPIIAIFIDNEIKTGKRVGNIFQPPLKELDNYFNSDGNVRFIHVDPTNPNKPHSLLEATQIAIKEYAKRNTKFRENLPQELKDSIDKIDYQYPIDKTFLPNRIKSLQDEVNRKNHPPQDQDTDINNLPPETNGHEELGAESTTNNEPQNTAPINNTTGINENSSGVDIPAGNTQDGKETGDVPVENPPKKTKPETGNVKPQNTNKKQDIPSTGVEESINEGKENLLKRTKTLFSKKKVLAAVVLIGGVLAALLIKKSQNNKNKNIQHEEIKQTTTTEKKTLIDTINNDSNNRELFKAFLKRG